MNTATATKPASASSLKTKKIFTLGVVTPITKGQNGEEIVSGLEAASEYGFRVLILAVGDESSQQKCLEIANKYPYTFEILEDNAQNKEKILDLSHVVVLSEKPTKAIFSKLQKKSVIPIVPEKCGFQNFNAQKESGNAFEYRLDSAWQVVRAIVRASENFQFTYDWRNLQKNLKEMEQE